MASKKGSKKRKRKPNTTPAVVAMNPKPRRRRRRAHNPAHKSRRRRRGNPISRQSIVGLANFPTGSSILYALLADAVMGFAVRRLRPKWGTGIMGQAAVSPYGGEAWDAQSYMLAGLALVVGSRLMKAWRGEQAAKDFAHSGWTQLARRVAYTEVLARSQWAQNTFGQVAQVMDDDGGTRWIQTPEGGWYAMQGLVPATPMGQLVPEGPMGYYHGLRPARPIDRQWNVGNQATFPGRDMGMLDNRDDAYSRAWAMTAA